MAFVKNCERYSAFLYPSDLDTLARINFYCEDDHRLYVLFQDPGEGELPDNVFLEAYNIGRSYALLSQYPNYIDLVRNEGPIRVVFRPEDSPPRFVVYASHEEVGEGEM